MTEEPTQRQDDVLLQISNQALAFVFSQHDLQLPQGRQLTELQTAATQRNLNGTIGNYEEFMRILGVLAPDMSERDRHGLWREFLGRLEDTTVESCKRNVQSGNTAGRDRDLRLTVVIIGSDVRTQRSDYGETDTQADRQASALIRVGEGATDQQREDMLRAAGTMGFSAAAIFAAQARFNEDRRSRSPQDVSDELAMAETNLNDYMRELMIRRMQELRSVESQISLNGETPQLRQQRDEAAWGLARLMGGSQAKFEEAREAGRDGTDATVARIWAETEGQRALHMHQLGKVVPRHAA